MCLLEIVTCQPFFFVVKRQLASMMPRYCHPQADTNAFLKSALLQSEQQENKGNIPSLARALP